MTEEGFSLNLAPLIPYSAKGGGGPPQIKQVLGLTIKTKHPMLARSASLRVPET